MESLTAITTKAQRFPSVLRAGLVLALYSPALTAQNNAAKKSAPAPAKAAPAKPAPANNSHAAPPATVGHPASAVAPSRNGVTPGRPAAVSPATAHGPMNRPAPRGATEMHNTAGSVRMRPGGHSPMDVHDARRNMDIHHNLAGGRRIESMRPDGRRFVSERGRPGYIGHPYSIRGHEFERRTYYDHGRAYDRFYRPYGYRGYNLRVYTPNRYYPAAYYGWAYRPWGAPVHYGWGFAGTPWYGAYGGYLAPYPVYASPSLWLTDYMLSQTLASAYQARLEAGDGGGAPVAYAGPPASPQAKQMVADEVQNTIALENQEAAANQQQAVPDPASSGVVRLLSDGRPHAFVTGHEVDVVDDSGLECALTDGDILQLAAAPAPQETTANVTVMASKGGKDCHTGVRVTVAFDELQEMQNHMREQVDAGLQELAAKQGSGGLPTAPASALATPAPAMVAEGAPAPDPNGAQELSQQEAQAQVAEKEVLAGTPGAAPTSDKTATEDLFKPQ